MARNTCAAAVPAEQFEDDLVSAPNFQGFMNEVLRVYRDRTDVFSVTGCNDPLHIPKDYPEGA